MSDALPDLLRPGLQVAFCGTAAGTASARAKAYYAGPGNSFWRTLFATGMTQADPWQGRGKPQGAEGDLTD